VTIFLWNEQKHGGYTKQC